MKKPHGIKPGDLVASMYYMPEVSPIVFRFNPETHTGADNQIVTLDHKNICIVITVNQTIAFIVTNDVLGWIFIEDWITVELSWLCLNPDS